MLDDEVRNLILRDVPASEVGRTVRQKGMRTLREDGLQKVRDGVTTIEEVLRVTTS